MRVLLLCILSGSLLSAEVRTMTLRQAVDAALSQNPDLLLARLDQQKSRYQAVRAGDAFVPKVVAGSGAAWTHGFPNSIEGSAPSIIQARTSMAIFNRPQSYLQAQAREGIRTAGSETNRKQDEVVFRVVSLYLDAEQAARSLDAARRQVENLQRVRELVDQRVGEGRELALESKKANLAVLRAAQAVDGLSVSLVHAETSLGLAVGLNPDDRVHPAAGERPAMEVSVSEDASIEEALENSHEIKTLQSNMQGKMLEAKSYRAEKLPKVNLVAQYSLFAKYNYQDYFSKFQRNNWQFGASFELPLFVGRAPNALASEADLEVQKLRIQVNQVRSRITADLRTAYQNLRRAEAVRDVARADLDVTREELNILVAQMDEGRLPVARVEAARATENEKWLALYDAEHNVEVARVNVLRQTGTLEAAVR